MAADDHQCNAWGAFKYAGRRLNPETGLYYYRARYYAPTLGRFLQTDPVGYKDDVNLYAYVQNDPTNKADPSGLDEVDLFRPIFGGDADHEAKLVGHDGENGKAGKWTYMSKDGSKGANPYSGPSKSTISEYSSLKDALKAATSGDHPYTSANIHDASAEQDKKNIEATSSAVKSNYNGTDANCGEAVAVGSKAAGIPNADHTNQKDNRNWQNSEEGKKAGWKLLPLPNPDDQKH